MTDRLIELDFSPEAVVVGNGDFPVHRRPLALLEGARFTVCCDGAANGLLDRGRVPDCIVGDGDSLRPDYRQRYASLLHLSADQETNDQTKAVHHLATLGMRSVAIVAATGKREDHTLGNISLLVDYRRQGMDVRIYTDYGAFVAVEGDCRFAARPGSQVSVFGFGTEGMESEGLAYPLRDFTNWWQGTLNQVVRSPFGIRCRGEYLVFLNYPEAASGYRGR